jgi:glucose/arabinose dehydrogenase
MIGRRVPSALTMGLVAGLLAGLAACGDDDGGAEGGSAVIVTTTSTAPTGATASSTGSTAVESPSPPTSDVRPMGDPTVAFEEVTRLEQPLGLAWRDGDPTLYVIEQPGRITAVDPATGAGRTVLDITDLTEAAGERGLLGLAFAPDGSKAYVNYSGLGDSGNAGRTVVAEYEVTTDGTFAGSSRRVVLEIDQPYRNHNGGHLAFGPDGLLYIGMGDGGSAGDPERRALDLSTVLGKLLRIDPTPSADAPYTVPPDNPYVGVEGAAPEIFATGLRNPWKFAFDPVTADLWIADVGQNRFEEVNVVEPPGDGRTAGHGLSFGWSAFEGTGRFNADVDPDGHTPPALTYEHGADGCSISGGAPYRGSAVPELTSGYVYSDFCSGRVWAFDRIGGRNVLLGTLTQVTAVLPGPDQELYVISGAGPIHRIVDGG